MFQPKEISLEAVPEALEKAERYRLLNEPAEAESICLDILAADSENQQAIITLLLAVTDRFSKGYGVSETKAKELLPRIKGEYERTYYTGIVAERQGKAKLTAARHFSHSQAYDCLREAMNWYEKAEAIRPPGNDDAIIRWNTCARMIAHNKLTGREEERVELPLD